MKKFYKYFEVFIFTSLILSELISLTYFIKMKYIFLIPIYQILYIGSNQTGFIINIIIFSFLALIPLIGILIFKKAMIFFHILFLAILFLYIAMFAVTYNNIRLLEQALRFFG